MFKRILRICTVGAVAGIFFIPINPVNSKLSNIAFLGCILGAWIGLTILSWKKKPLRWVVLVLPLCAVVPFIIPGSEIDSNKLRKDYVQRMAEFEGTKYFWGGESGRGIDCSGLPRRALRDALLSYGLKNANGRAFRSYLEHWWFDASAKALGEGYRNYTSPIGISGTIQEMDYSQLIIGDLAVTTNGVHVLAYAGDGKWIQAAPEVGSVITLDGKTSGNTWFRVPVTTHRWTITK